LSFLITEHTLHLANYHLAKECHLLKRSRSCLQLPQRITS
jgi:hypothetical protein